MNISDLLQNSSIVDFRSCNCIVPEAVIPTHWRIVILLNLVFTSLVYLTFVLRKKETSSLKELIDEAKKTDLSSLLKLIVWCITFSLVLVMPATEKLYSYLQIAALILLVALLRFQRN